MSDKISSQISTMMNPFGPQWIGGSGQTSGAKEVGKQVQDALFGKRKPPTLDPEDFPEVQELLQKLNSYLRKFVNLIGDEQEDYRIQLADGTIAMIDSHGTIYMGIRFMLQFQNKVEVILGALAHEVGHRPQRWGEYKQKQDLTKEELHELCRYEETRADLFAGRALAEVDLKCDPMIKFLKDIEEGPHPDYFPAAVRAEVIKEGHLEQTNRANLRKKYWPELERMTVKYHVGDF